MAGTPTSPCCMSWGAMISPRMNWGAMISPHMNGGAMISLPYDEQSTIFEARGICTGHAGAGHGFARDGQGTQLHFGKEKEGKERGQKEKHAHH